MFLTGLQDMFIQDWHSRLDLSGLYHHLSTKKFCYKSKLDSISLVKFRIAITRLRIAARRLLIEMGRWVKPKTLALKNRNCINCNLTEDEFHFFMFVPSCKHLSDITFQNIIQTGLVCSNL